MSTLAAPQASAATLEALQRVSVKRITPTIGAQVHGVHLGDLHDDAQIAAIRQLLLEHKVLVFRDQEITPAQHVAFASRFGELEIHPVFAHHADHPELVLLGGNAKSGRENIFHSDVTWRATPSMGSILRCVECPEAGGDTIWVNMAAAYEALPAYIKEQIQDLLAVHDILPSFMERAAPADVDRIRAEFPPQAHPVVRTHPETGEKLLFVNEGFVTHIANFVRSPRFNVMTEFKTAERQLLDYLFAVAKYPEYQMRLHWEPNTVVFWDNRCTQHYAIQDYHPAPRRMMRATVVGDAPF
ncbi:MAG TPA: TauD/TfdA family dioxygenase [Ramlibacter sp.]|nr:TauD/TfdA family dioxygenase [Ramlibacter sp.]